jgi:hypothetical protein
MDKNSGHLKTTPGLRKPQRRAIMKTVELRGLEPLTPSLPGGPDHSTCGNRAAPRKNGAVQCSWLPFDAYLCSRFAPGETV